MCSSYVCCVPRFPAVVLPKPVGLNRFETTNPRQANRPGCLHYSGLPDVALLNSPTESMLKDLADGLSARDSMLMSGITQQTPRLTTRTLHSGLSEQNIHWGRPPSSVSRHPCILNSVEIADGPIVPEYSVVLLRDSHRVS